MASSILATGSVSIIDLMDGESPYSVTLSSETHSILCDEFGKPKENEIGLPTSKAKTKITAMKGSTVLTPIDEDEAFREGTFKYKIVDITEHKTCLGERIDNDEFYIKEIYKDSGQLDVQIFLESDKNYFYKSFTWNKVLDGESSKYISLIGPSNFYYDNKNDATSIPTTISIRAIISNVDNYNLKWKYKTLNDSDYKDIESKEGSLIENDTLTIDDKVLFGSSNFVEIKCILINLNNNAEYETIHSVGKVYNGIDGEDGEDAYTITLTNERYTILCDSEGNPKEDEINSPNCNASSKIIVKKGKGSLTPVAESVTPGVGQWKFKFEPNPVNCSAVRVGDDGFYLSSVTGNSGIVSVTAYLEGVDPLNKITKEFTWNKVLDGSSSPYIRIHGEQFFKYDNSSDTTPTPSQITITAEAFNIDSPSFVWQIHKGTWTDITNEEGSVISGASLTINDTKLFDEANSIRIRCYASNVGENIYDSITITKVYDGNDGVPGDPSKTVLITGPNVIKYNSENVPNFESIELKAVPTNYKTPTFKWYKLIGSVFESLDLTTSSITFNHTDLDDTNIIKVECMENNKSDLSFYEFQVTKAYDGTDGIMYNVFILKGTRNICYNGKNALLTTQITPFELEVYKDKENIIGTPSVKSITWSTNGHYTNPTNVGGNTFTPVPLDKYDETKLDTSVSVVVNADGRILKATIPISVSKNESALDWVEEWDGSKVDIGGTYIITPKIFAGKKDLQTNTITGLAMGQDIVNKSDDIGMAIYHNNNIIGKIHAKPDGKKMVVFGKDEGSQFIVDTDGFVTIQGDLKVESGNKLPGTIGGIVGTVEDVNESLVQANSEIKDVKDSVASLKEYSDGALKDGILTQAEKEGYKSNLKTLASEKKDIDSQYSSLSGNSNCYGTPYTNLKNAYNSYVSAYNDLVSKINYIIGLSTISVTERNDLNNKFIAHDNALSTYSTRVQEAITSISENQSNDAVDGLSQSEIFDKLTNNGVTQGIYMSGRKIYINGSYIQAGTIACNRLGSPSGSEAVIKLFQQGSDIDCRIDARPSDGVGNVNAIRLQFNPNNYLFISANGATFYQGGVATYNFKPGEFYFDGTTMRSSGSTLYFNKSINVPSINSDSHTHSFSASWSNISGKPSTFPPSSHTHNYASSSHTHYVLEDDYNGRARVAVFGGNSAWTFRQHCSVEMNLGNGANRWGPVFSNTGSIQTSSKKHKINIEYIDDMQGKRMFRTSTTPFIDFIKDMFRPATYRLMAKNTDADTGVVYDQIGFIAEDIAKTDIGKTFVYNVEEDEAKEPDYMYSTSGYVTVVATALQEEILKREEEIQTLRIEKEQLEAKVNNLEAKLDQLIASLNK